MRPWQCHHALSSCLPNASCVKHYPCPLQADLDEALPCTAATSLKINSRVQSVVLPNLRTIQNTFSACDASPACLQNPSLPACCDSASPAVGALPSGGLLQTQALCNQACNDLA